MSVTTVVRIDHPADSNGPGIRGYLHIPETASGQGIVATHGASGHCNSELLKGLAGELCAASYAVLRCDLPFRQARSYGPPSRGSAERDQAGLRQAVEYLKKHASVRLFLAGHSYGGRQSSMLAASDDKLVDGLLLLSYPLHPPRKPHQLRTAHFPGVHTRALFVQGTHDDFATIQELREALRLIPAETKLLPIEEAGHSLLTKQNRASLPGEITGHFRAFFRG